MYVYYTSLLIIVKHNCCTLQGELTYKIAEGNLCVIRRRSIANGSTFWSEITDFLLTELTSVYRIYIHAPYAIQNFRIL